ncbi:hypothetical protein HPB52_021698 [Rhipicephalus sanguineus]|uniref:Uncharacterized protein n=1 Tax=Rhipicephalus sanguineus TaxID=34632 RepID=A0A9D4Q869_RHISA|nr:hypothetical protein HPB52_021698 [Rhipicephalus sanguineus]
MLRRVVIVRGNTARVAALFGPSSERRANCCRESAISGRGSVSCASPATVPPTSLHSQYRFRPSRRSGRNRSMRRAVNSASGIDSACADVIHVEPFAALLEARPPAQYYL